MKKLLGGSTVAGELEGPESALGTCCWHYADWSQRQCRLTKADAIFSARANHAMWCCDSCPPGMW